jgi:DNA-binding PadR family transcriptional regulator
MHGYQLKSEFETQTASTWPLNVGQVYTTLGRLERDGLVERGEVDADGRAEYRLTDAGRQELVGWFARPVERRDRPRDELAIKLSLALVTPGVDFGSVIQNQRSATLRTLQDYTRLKAKADPVADAAWLLVLEAMLFQGEAEIRWLDYCEEYLRALPPPGPRPAAEQAARPATRPVTR